MRLRTRLILAFLVLSILPLSAVTAYSYITTREAFRRAAELKSNLMAEELGVRMENVTADLGRRVTRLWSLSRPPSDSPPADAARAAGSADTVARELGGFLPLLEGVELVPSARAPAAPPRPGQPGPPRSRVEARTDKAGPGQTPGAPAAPPPVVLDIPRPEGGYRTRRIPQSLQAEILSAAGAAATVRSEAVQATQEVAQATREASDLRGGMLDFQVVEQGQRVGQIHARLNLEQMLLGVLSLTRRDQGEIPFAIDPDGAVHTPRNEDRALLSQMPLVTAARNRADGPASNDNWIVVTRHAPSGVVFGIARPIGESIADIRRTAARNLGLGLGLIVLALVGTIPISGRMTRNLTRLTAGVERIAQGDLAARVDVRSRDEFGTLATAFNRMAEDLATHERLVVERERLRRELELSRQIQTDMLPHEALRLGVAEVKGVSIPAREVGGDFFDYFVLPGGELALLVGDVSGKGISAALLMANIQATLRARLPLEPDLRSLIDAIDHEIHRTTPPEVYLTLFAGILDPVTRRLRYVNAGHNPQFVVRATGVLEQLSSGGRPVGLLPGHGYEQREVMLDEGDLLFFYTDGTVEVENEAGEMFGFERLAEVLAKERDAGVEDLLALVEHAVREFRGQAEPSDDATLMALRLGPHSQSPPGGTFSVAASF